MINQFERDVLHGLSKKQKTLSSKYFYDKRGDALFQQIMAMPEYYLTRAEAEIFETKSTEIVASFKVEKERPFQLIELGAGDGTKTILLLRTLLKEGYNLEYIPIDISQNALNGLQSMLASELPELRVSPRQGTYFRVLDGLGKTNLPKVVLFLGSNLGNLLDEEATNFLFDLGSNLQRNDKLLLGLDTKKPRDVVLPAYHDSQGITSKFNLNLLHRINRELQGNFDVSQFQHIPFYEENEGIAKSYIESLEEQSVEIGAGQHTFFFKKGERIHTEISRKYSRSILEDILEPTSFEIDKIHTDKANLFMDVLLKRH